MEYLDIIEENFTTEEFVAYLRGRILEYLLSEQPLVLSEFKLYANKLVEVVKDQELGLLLKKHHKNNKCNNNQRLTQMNQRCNQNTSSNLVTTLSSPKVQ